MSLRRLEVERRPVDVAAYRGAFADASHVEAELAEPCAVYVDGAEQPSVVYVELEERQPNAVAALRSLRYSTGYRLRGLPSTSRTFGYAPPIVSRGRETCDEAKLAREAPAAHSTIAGLAEVVEREYREHNAEAYAEHAATVAKVLPEWRLSGGVFTSGIVNYNNKLPYHFDGGNFPECWSNMLVFKASCQGGDLVCPELGLCFRLRDHSLFMFDGQAILHGVSPFRFVRPEGYRYSVVFYSLQQMWRCDTKAEIVQASARRRTERERRRFAPS